MSMAIRRALIIGAALLTWIIPAVVSSGHITAASVPGIFNIVPTKAPGGNAPFADFGAEIPSPDARHVADWIADSRDADGLAFIIIDKVFAKMYVFDGNARLRDSTPVLLGAAQGDESVPNIGTRPIAEIKVEERTTPAGRFVAERGHNNRGEDVVWVDYDAAVSMHRVRSANPEERRLERLATVAVDDNRISYGCINVPVVFYEAYIRPLFAARRAMVYVLPEVTSVRQVFASYDVAVAHGVGIER